ncbi:hypothetical protein OROMI_020512 [Orobanche minor]
MSIPPRILHFIWRCCNNSLPLPDNLAHRGIKVDPTCQVCEMPNGSALHLFFQCEFSILIWQMTGLLDIISSFDQPSSALWFQAMINFGDMELSSFFSVLCYFIWFQQNKFIFEGTKVDANRLLPSASKILLDFCDSSGCPERFSPSLLKQPWSLPPRKGVRIYFDGAISLRNSCAGCRIFVSDESNNFIFGLSRMFAGIQNPEVAEFLALREFFVVIQDLKLRDVSILGDAEAVIISAKGMCSPSSICLPLLKDIQCHLKQIILGGLCWISRAENTVAHEFAYFAKNSNVCISSWSVPLDFLLSFRAG